MSISFDFKDKVVVITGGARGIGLCIRQQFEKAGARVCVIDIGEGPIELVNPVIEKEEGEQFEVEGCLSLPGQSGVTKRPMKVTVRAQNRKGESYTISGEGLLARAFCHEIDHLNGILYKDKLVSR